MEPNMLLIGSHALNYHFPEQVPGPGRFIDKDFICSYEDLEEWKKNKKFRSLYPIDSGKKMVGKFLKEGICEFELAWEKSTAEAFLQLVDADPETSRLYAKEPDNFLVPSLNALFALKCSHKYLRNSPHFLKTMNDINFMKSKGAVISDHYKAWFKIREKETYNYKHPNLEQNKMGFFNPNEGIKYVYDHDSIHRQVAQGERPAYTYYQKDNSEVQCDKDKFFTVSEEVRLNGVFEEAMVLALERSQIPYKGKVEPKRSFEIALQKVCSSITSGWFRAYAYDHYHEVLNLYDEKYVEKFWVAVANGRVKELDK